MVASYGVGAEPKKLGCELASSKDQASKAKYSIVYDLKTGKSEVTHFSDQGSPNSVDS
jgi:hypothetical protein